MKNRLDYSVLVTTELADGIAVLTLNRPEAMNALSNALQIALAEALLAADADPDVRVIILTGAGDRAFSAGLDLRELGEDATSLGRERTASTDPVLALDSCSKPVIAAINGVAVTGGFELALSADILIASDRARFADTHARVGVMPGWGLSQKLSRAIGLFRAKELSLSGNFLSAQTALDWGLVNRVTTPETLMIEARSLAANIADVDPVMISRYKDVIDRGFARSFGDGLELEREVAAKSNQKVDATAVEARRAAVLSRGRNQ